MQLEKSGKQEKKRLNYKQHVWDAFILLIYIKCNTCFFDETGSHSTFQVALELTMSLSQASNLE